MQPTAPVIPKFDIAGAEDSKENDCYGRMKCDLFSRKQSRRHSVGGSFFFCVPSGSLPEVPYWHSIR